MSELLFKCKLGLFHICIKIFRNQQNQIKMWYFATPFYCVFFCSGLQAYFSINTSSLCGVRTSLQKELCWSTCVGKLMPYMRTKSPWSPSLFLICLCKKFHFTLNVSIEVRWGAVGLTRRANLVWLLTGELKEQGAETAMLANVLHGGGMAHVVLLVIPHLRVASGVTWDNPLYFSVHSVQVVTVGLPGKALWDLLEMAPN